MRIFHFVRLKSPALSSRSSSQAMPVTNAAQAASKQGWTSNLDKHYDILTILSTINRVGRNVFLGDNGLIAFGPFAYRLAGMGAGYPPGLSRYTEKGPILHLLFLSRSSVPPSADRHSTIR